MLFKFGALLVLHLSFIFNSNKPITISSNYMASVSIIELLSPSLFLAYLKSLVATTFTGKSPGFGACGELRRTAL